MDKLILLHGNTASSKMSELLMPLYEENFRCILIDFLGNGQSDPVESFSPDMWYDEALQTEHLQCGKVSIIRTRGGAWAAVNAALECPDLFYAIIADSFDGRTLNENLSANPLSERKAAKENAQSRQFYEYCQGADWENVIDIDTEALLRCAKESVHYYISHWKNEKRPHDSWEVKKMKVAHTTWKKNTEKWLLCVLNPLYFFFQGEDSSFFQCGTIRSTDKKIHKPTHNEITHSRTT